MKARVVVVTVHAPHLAVPPPLPPKSASPPPTIQPVGLGDVVAFFAKPVARAVDKVLGSSKANCQPCSLRQKRLNAIIPDIRQPFTRK